MVKKATVIAAGQGKRLRPLTLGVPKELLLLGKQPLIFYCLEQIKNAGIRKVQVVTGWKKGTLQDTLGSGQQYDLRISYAFQDSPKGLGHAIHQVKHFANGEDIAVLLGDNIITPGNVLEKLTKFHKEKESTATLLVQEVDNPERFGVVNVDENRKILSIFEKPVTEEEKKPFRQPNGKYLAITGMYVFTKKVFDAIENTEPSARGEIEITDSIGNLIMDGENCYAMTQNIVFRDVGTFKSLFATQKELMENFDVENESKWWENKRQQIL